MYYGHHASPSICQEFYIAKCYWAFKSLYMCSLKLHKYAHNEALFTCHFTHIAFVCTVSSLHLTLKTVHTLFTIVYLQSSTTSKYTTFT